MRTTYGDKIIESEEGVRIGIINGDNHFRPASGVGLTAEQLEFILNEIRGQADVCRVPLTKGDGEDDCPSEDRVVKRRKDRNSRATRLAELLRVIRANNIHGCDLHQFSNLSQACVSKLINGKTTLPRESTLATMEDAVDRVIEELEVIRLGA